MIQYELTQNQFFDFNSNNNQLGIDLAVTKFSDIIFKAASLSIGLKTYQT